ncbi:MAG: MBL fold metallo-hydrolase [Actinomyces sp.]|nr:MAG: MBL fold metallo-hydrolase [Actinomyces sp.]
MSTPPHPPTGAGEPRPATDHTRAANAAAAHDLPRDDTDIDRATRGLVARIPEGRITHEGRLVWDIGAYAFCDDDAPDTVNPSLWRQARLNAVHGLFEVTDGVWQARGYDISNVTFIAGEEGWIVIDPLTTEFTARACLELANATLGARPVTAVIYTHSHADHFGGVLGVTSREDVEAGRVRIIAPEGFLREAVAENVVAGPAMIRRAGYMFGPLLEPGPRGHVDCGLGKGIPRGRSALVAPTEEIAETGTELVVDGVRIVFQNTPDTEAPAEMNFFFPDKALLCMAENCTGTMHNVLTPRGAQVRDALAWSKYVNEAIELFADDTEVCFASHNWPTWGRAEVRSYLERQRDLYRWIHDQTLRLANRGLTPVEIAAELRLPGCFADHGDTRGYYGTVSHNCRAVYQRYFGFFDGNPAHLDPLPPVEAGRRYVDAMGGAEAVLAEGRRAFEAGDYRWVAMLVDHLVFADPANAEARELQAAALEQLGYQAESGPWRNFYLTGALELRRGVAAPEQRPPAEFLGALTAEQIFDALGVRLDAARVEGVELTINWTFVDHGVRATPDAPGERHVLGVANCALHHTPGRHDPAAAAGVVVSRATLGRLLTGALAVPDALEAGELAIDGDAGALLTLFGALEAPDGRFAIVEP